ncbi:hypothetical protein EB118_12475, partial [bacterium]|nr:hypothetical protein [bacterium]
LKDILETTIDSTLYDFTFYVTTSDFDAIDFNQLKTFYDTHYHVVFEVGFFKMLLFLYDGILLRAQLGNTTIGYFIGTRKLYRFGGKKTCLSEGTMLCIHKDYRNKGVARSVICELVKWGITYHKSDKFMFCGSLDIFPKHFCITHVCVLKNNSSGRSANNNNSQFQITKNIQYTKGLHKVFNHFYKTHFDVSCVLKGRDLRYIFRDPTFTKIAVLDTVTKEIAAMFVLYAMRPDNALLVGEIMYMYFNKFEQNHVQTCLYTLQSHLTTLDAITCLYPFPFPLDVYVTPNVVKFYALNMHVPMCASYRCALTPYS